MGSLQQRVGKPDCDLTASEKGCQSRNRALPAAPRQEACSRRRPGLKSYSLRRLLLLEQARNTGQRILLALSVSFVGECVFEETASHSLYVRNELAIRCGSLNYEGEAPAAGSQPRHLRHATDGASAEVGHHLEIDCVRRGDRARTRKHTKSRNCEIDIFRSSAIGSDVHVGAEVLDDGVVPADAFAR